MDYLLIAGAGLVIGALVYVLSRPRKGAADLITPPLEDPAWDQGDSQALEKLCAYVEGRATSAIKWYYDRKRSKSSFSRTYRYFAILLTGASGLIPIITTALPVERGEALRYQQFGYICVGLAALFVALDRFSGSSSAWMRFVTAATSLESLLEQFRLDWQRMRALSLGQPLSPEVRDRFLQRLLEFSSAVSGQIEKETQEWVREFQAKLAQLEEQARARLKETEQDVQRRGAEMVDEAKARRPGIINLTVQNAGQTDAGYTVFLDENEEPVVRDVAAREYALPRMPPGLHTLRVEAAIGGRRAQASRGSEVRANEIVSVAVELTTIAAAGA